MIISNLNWIVGAWHCLLVGALAAAAGALSLVDVCQLRVRASTLLLLALDDHTWVFLLVLLQSATQVALAAAVGHWVVIGRRFSWFQ